MFKPDFDNMTGKLEIGDLIYVSSGKEETTDHVVISTDRDSKTGKWFVIASYDMGLQFNRFGWQLYPVRGTDTDI